LKDKDDRVSLWPDFPLTGQNSHLGGLQRAMTDIYITVTLQENAEMEDASAQNGTFWLVD